MQQHLRTCGKKRGAHTCLHPLRRHVIWGAAPVAHVAGEAADEADVGVCVHKNLDVAQVAEPRVGEDEDALDKNDLARLDVYLFVRMDSPRVGGEVLRECMA